ncbi:hypothetical protein [Bacillus massilinigeriensis]|uniref:hypothetical protein n=1 Tax=Bacillus mediterraneensis TaxID=1805474 RepID=UPI0008F8CFDC|nr:hypothetical protein [Bacillus mediterraneensis]
MNKLFSLSWLYAVVCLILVGCSETSELKDVTNFSTEKKGDYLLFHLIDPFKEEGYISEVKNTGEVVYKHIISDKHFAPSDVFQYNGNFFFASGAYSDDSKVMMYSPLTQKLSLIKTNQKEYIEKYYNNGSSEYIITVMDKHNSNHVCDIKKNHCVKFSDKYTAQDVTTLNDDIIVVGVDQNANGNKENVTIIKKLNKNLELIKEVPLNLLPNYFTYTSPDQRLYLFMINGDIVKIDSNLNINKYSVDLSSVSKNTTRVVYNKNVMIDRENILINLEIQESKKNLNLLAKISFEDEEPKIEIVEDSTNESILNVDSKSNEVYTRSYINEETVITVRDTKILKVKNKLKLDNKDPIYFVDNIKK